MYVIRWKKSLGHVKDLKRQNLNKEVLPLLLSGSPDCSIDRTFIYKFYFQTAVKKSSITKKTYRNPIYLAKEYKEMIDLGRVKNQAELARKLGISRARVTQILNLLKLEKIIMDRLEKIGDPLDRKAISERKLRKIIHKKKYPNTNYN